MEKLSCESSMLISSFVFSYVVGSLVAIVSVVIAASRAWELSWLISTAVASIMFLCGVIGFIVLLKRENRLFGKPVSRS